MGEEEKKLIYHKVLEFKPYKPQQQQNNYKECHLKQDWRDPNC